MLPELTSLAWNKAELSLSDDGTAATQSETGCVSSSSSSDNSRSSHRSHSSLVPPLISLPASLYTCSTQQQQHGTDELSGKVFCHLHSALYYHQHKPAMQVHAFICKSLTLSSTPQPFIWFSCFSYLSSQNTEFLTASHSAVLNTLFI